MAKLLLDILRVRYSTRLVEKKPRVAIHSMVKWFRAGWSACSRFVHFCSLACFSIYPGPLFFIRTLRDSSTRSFARIDAHGCHVGHTVESIHGLGIREIRMQLANWRPRIRGRNSVQRDANFLLSIYTTLNYICDTVEIREEWLRGSPLKTFTSYTWSAFRFLFPFSSSPSLDPPLSFTIRYIGRDAHGDLVSSESPRDPFRLVLSRALFPIRLPVDVHRDADLSQTDAPVDELYGQVLFMFYIHTLCYGVEFVSFQ